MKPLSQNVFTSGNKPALCRKIGILFFAVTIASFLFAYFGAAYFADGNYQSKITYAMISGFVGVVLSILGSILISIPDYRLEIDSATGKIFLTQKLISTKFEEFSFADVERVQFTEHAFENHTAYLLQIVLRGGRIIKVPSDSEGDEKKQREIFERVENFLAK